MPEACPQGRNAGSEARSAGSEGRNASSEALDPEDVKIVTLARSARARAGAAQGAAVRDTEGRIYAAATVSLPSLQLTALQAAVAAAVSSGAPGLEAAAVVGGGADAASLTAVWDLAPTAAVLVVDEDGGLREVLSG